MWLLIGNVWAFIIIIFIIFGDFFFYVFPENKFSY